MLGCSPPVHCIYPHQGCRFYRQGECVLRYRRGKDPRAAAQGHCEEGYTGFLTLEPHLVLFDSLQSLETTDAKNIIRENKYKNGAEGYAAQYHALCDILAKF